MRFGHWLSIAIICLSAAGCRGDDADKAAVLAAVIGHEHGRWTDPRRIPCFMPDVKKSSFADGDHSAYPLASSLVSEPFKICGKQVDAYFQLHDPDIVGNKAAVEIDFHCGDLCGSGDIVYLERTGQGWKYGEKRQRWIS